ncbi:MAG: hypothetical protein RLZZ350_24 [Verrucomicrobiota bacterium]|jgi:hypothetical protein
MNALRKNALGLLVVLMSGVCGCNSLDWKNAHGEYDAGDPYHGVGATQLQDPKAPKNDPTVGFVVPEKNSKSELNKKPVEQPAWGQLTKEKP